MRRGLVLLLALVCTSEALSVNEKISISSKVLQNAVSILRVPSTANPTSLLKDISKSKLLRLMCDTALSSPVASQLLSLVAAHPQLVKETLKSEMVHSLIEGIVLAENFIPSELLTQPSTALTVSSDVLLNVAKANSAEWEKVFEELNWKAKDFSSFLEFDSVDQAIDQSNYALMILSYIWVAVLCISGFTFVLVIVAGVVSLRRMKFWMGHSSTWMMLGGVMALTLFVGCYATQSVFVLIAAKNVLQTMVNLFRFLTNMQTVSTTNPQNLCMQSWYSSTGQTNATSFIKTPNATVDAFDLYYSAEGDSSQWSPIALWNIRRQFGEKTIPNPSYCCFDPSSCSGTLPSQVTCPGYWMFREGSSGMCACLRAMLDLGLQPDLVTASSCLFEIRDRLQLTLSLNA